jgi:hypothetical protein
MNSGALWGAAGPFLQGLPRKRVVAQWVIFSYILHNKCKKTFAAKKASCFFASYKNQRFFKSKTGAEFKLCLRPWDEIQLPSFSMA